MTPLTIHTDIERKEDVVAGPETFEAPTITVVDGLKISPQAVEGEKLNGIATIFRLAGERFGGMHELNNLRVLEGRLIGRSEHPIETGALVTIGWEDPSRCACQGTVALALRTGDGWSVTIELDSALAA